MYNSQSGGWRGDKHPIVNGVRISLTYGVCAQ